MPVLSGKVLPLYCTSFFFLHGPIVVGTQTLAHPPAITPYLPLSTCLLLLPLLLLAGHGLIARKDPEKDPKNQTERN